MDRDHSVLAMSFIILVALLYSALIMGALWANNRVDRTKRWPVRWLRIFVGGFLLITGILSLDHVFTDFAGVPPNIMIAIFVANLGLITMAFRPIARQWLDELPQGWLIGLQAFRIVVEMQLYYLSLVPGAFPKEMTLHGRNFDIVTGLTAIPVAFWVTKLEREGKTALRRRVVSLWNAMGLMLLAVVVGHGMLSLPTPFRALMLEPPPIALGAFPFIWLPTFVVPFALLLHILSLRKNALN